MKISLRIVVTILMAQAGFYAASAQSRAIVADKRIALTLDGCMTEGMAKRVASGKEKPLFNKDLVDYLITEKIPATFFLSGLWAERNEKETRELAAQPFFEIGNHSYNHRAYSADCFSLPVIPDTDKEDDIRKSQEILTRLTGKKPRLFRFPGGCFQSSDLVILGKYGLQQAGWTFASGDAFNPNEAAIVENVLRKAKPGAIIVFHLAGGRYAPCTNDVIRQVVPELRKRGYQFCTYSDLGKKKK